MNRIKLWLTLRLYKAVVFDKRGANCNRQFFIISVIRYVLSANHVGGYFQFNQKIFFWIGRWVSKFLFWIYSVIPCFVVLEPMGFLLGRNAPNRQLMTDHIKTPDYAPTNRQKWNLKKVVIWSFPNIGPKVVLSAMYPKFWHR